MQLIEVFDERGDIHTAEQGEVEGVRGGIAASAIAIARCGGGFIYRRNQRFVLRPLALPKFQNNGLPQRFIVQTPPVYTQKKESAV